MTGIRYKCKTAVGPTDALMVASGFLFYTVNAHQPAARNLGAPYLGVGFLPVHFCV